MIASATYPNGEKTTYYYEDSANLYALTGKSSNDGVRYATWSYDSLGRATSSKHGPNADLDINTFAYGTNQVTITNPLGKQEIVNFTTTAQGNVLPTSIQGQASTNCPVSNASYTYDANDFLATETDEEGRVTRYVRDARGRPTSITRGYGSAQATTTTMTWHATLNVPTQVVEPGLTTDLTWNALGQLTQLKQTDTTSQTVPFSTAGRTRIWAYTYGTGGLVTSVDGPLSGTGDTVSYTYNANGYLQTSTNELGHVTTVTAWNGRGQPTSVTDQNGTVMTYAYDAQGRVTSIVTSPGSTPTTWTMTYTAAGDLATVQEPSGASYTLTWDSARRLSTIATSASETMTYVRDAMGDVTSRTIDTPGYTVLSQTNTFDELGRMIKQVGGEGRTWTFGYDKTDNLKTVTDPRTNTLSYGYDAVNRLVTETERDTGVVTHTYNGKDEHASYKDPRNLTTTYVRNGFGEVIQEASPDRGTSVYDYDARGLMISKKDARNVTATYAYDNAGRLTSRGYPTTALSETYTYDQVTAANGGAGGKGRLTKSVDAAGTTDYVYDARGRLTGEKRTIATYAHTVSYAYDANGRVSQITYPSGRMVLYDYDGMGRMVSVALKRTASSATEQIISYAGYHAFSGLRYMTVANDTYLLQYRDTEYSQSEWYVGEEIAGTRTNYIGRYHWREDGLNKTVINSDDYAYEETQHFTYDPAGRMATAQAYMYGSLAWTYDKVGNRLSETRTPSGGSTTTKTYTYPSTSNRLASIAQGGTTVRSFTYDAAGNNTVDTRSGTAYTYTISDAGRISQLKVGTSVRANYTYDAKNRLSIRQTLNSTPSGTTHVIHDQWDNVIVETNGTGTAVREYIWLGDVPVAVLDGSSTPANPTLLWVYADHLKRPELMLTATRQQVWKATYEPFGTVVAITGAAANNERLPGQWFQIEAGLAYNWNRHYDASLGRYTQADPLADNRPAAPQAVSSLGRDAAPGTSFLTDAPAVSASRLGSAALSSGLGYLLAAREDGAGPTSSLLANTPGTVPRDGPSAYGYARQSPVMWSDRSGLANFPFSPAITLGDDICEDVRFNPFRGRTFKQIIEMFRKKGFEPRGPSPETGKGGYMNPETGRSYHLDPGQRQAPKRSEDPHVDVNRDSNLTPSGGVKRKFPLD